MITTARSRIWFCDQGPSILWRQWAIVYEKGSSAAFILCYDSPLLQFDRRRDWCKTRRNNSWRQLLLVHHPKCSDTSGLCGWLAMRLPWARPRRHESDCTRHMIRGLFRLSQWLWRVNRRKVVFWTHSRGMRCELATDPEKGLNLFPCASDRYFELGQVRPPLCHITLYIYSTEIITVAHVVRASTMEFRSIPYHMIQNPDKISLFLRWFSQDIWRYCRNSNNTGYECGSGPKGVSLLTHLRNTLEEECLE